MAHHPSLPPHPHDTQGGRLQLDADIPSRHFYWVDLPRMAELGGVSEQRVFVEATSGALRRHPPPPMLWVWHRVH